MSIKRFVDLGSDRVATCDLKHRYGADSISESGKGADTSTISQIHVLAVDDSFVERRVIEKLLKTSSFKVTTVESASRALEVLGVSDGRLSSVQNAFQVNLIITDYCMPGMSGFDLLKKVKQVAALKKIPVVVMSSENVPTRIKMCLAEGAEEFILKPLQMEDIKRLEGHLRHGKSEVDTEEEPLSCETVPIKGRVLRIANTGCHRKRKMCCEDPQADGLDRSICQRRKGK